jgi:cell wall-associated NlpC family hydrolase
MKNLSLKKLLFTCVLSTTLLSTALAPFPIEGHAYAASSSVEKMIATGMKYLGTPYEFGSNRSTTKTFDCSDFTKHIFNAVGVTLPPTAATQAAYIKQHAAVKTSLSSLKRGDLMFFMSYHGSEATGYAKLAKTKQVITHVGVYLGNGKMLNTYSKESGGVRVDSIDNKHWEYRFVFGGSAL